MSASFNVDKDARLTVGRFTLDLHKNSLRMPATITLRVSSEDATEVEIEVVPAAANDFKVPAKLTANMSDKPGTNYATVWMWTEQGGSWAKANSVSANSTQQNVVAHLKQVSHHRVAEPEQGSATTAEDTMER